MVQDSPNIRYYATAAAFELYGNLSEGYKRLSIPCVPGDRYLHKTIDAIRDQQPNDLIVSGDGLEDFLSKKSNIREYADLLIYALTKDMTPIRTHVNLDTMRDAFIYRPDDKLAWSFPNISGFEHAWYTCLECSMAGLIGNGYESPANAEIWKDRISSFDTWFPLGYLA